MKNEHLDRCFEISLPVPEGTKSGDPLIIGDIPCVAAIDRQADGKATVKMGTGSFSFSVIAKKEAEEKAVVLGKPVYLKEGKLSMDTGGTLFGYALAEIAKGKTATIRVKLATV